VSGGNCHNEELLNLFSSLNIIRVIKSKRLRWAGLMGHIGRRVVHRGLFLGEEDLRKETSWNT